MYFKYVALSKLWNCLIIFQPIDEAVTVVTTRKANGEAAHFSCRSINGDFIMIAGSKNVHIMIKTRGMIIIIEMLLIVFNTCK